jgi:hypothetical protein
MRKRLLKEPNIQPSKRVFVVVTALCYLFLFVAPMGCILARTVVGVSAVSMLPVLV